MFETSSQDPPGSGYRRALKKYQYREHAPSQEQLSNPNGTDQNGLFHQYVVYLAQIILIQFARLGLQSQPGHEKVVTRLGKVSSR
jgi:hypothetical protein